MAHQVHRIVQNTEHLDQPIPFPPADAEQNQVACTASPSRCMQRMELVIEIGPRAGAGKSRPKSNASAFDASKQDVDDPDPKHISTSYTERANLTMRMSMRRFIRLTNAFSKKLENHAHMVALYALWYNFVRIHKTLRTSPAMAAGIESRLWSMEDVVAMIDAKTEKISGNTLVG